MASSSHLQIEFSLSICSALIVATFLTENKYFLGGDLK